MTNEQNSSSRVRNFLNKLKLNKLKNLNVKNLNVKQTGQRVVRGVKQNAGKIGVGVAAAAIIGTGTLAGYQTSKLNDLQDDHASLETAHTTLDNDYLTLSRNYDDLTTASADKSKRMGVLEASLTDADYLNGALKVQNQEASDRHAAKWAAAESFVTFLSDGKKDLRDAMSVLRSEGQEASAVYEGRLGEAQEALDQAIENTSELKKQYTELVALSEEASTGYGKELGRIQRELDQAKGLETKLEGSITDIQEDYAKIEEKLKETMNGYTQVQGQLDRTKEAYDREIIKADGLENEVGTLNTKIEGLEKSNEDLLEIISGYQSSTDSSPKDKEAVAAQACGPEDFAGYMKVDTNKDEVVMYSNNGDVTERFDTISGWDTKKLLKAVGGSDTPCGHEEEGIAYVDLEQAAEVLLPLTQEIGNQHEPMKKLGAPADMDNGIADSLADMILHYYK